MPAGLLTVRTCTSQEGGSIVDFLVRVNGFAGRARAGRARDWGPSRGPAVPGPLPGSAGAVIGLGQAAPGRLSPTNTDIARAWCARNGQNGHRHARLAWHVSVCRRSGDRSGLLRRAGWPAGGLYRCQLPQPASPIECWPRNGGANQQWCLPSLATDRAGVANCRRGGPARLYDPASGAYRFPACRFRKRSASRRARRPGAPAPACGFGQTVVSRTDNRLSSAHHYESPSYRALHSALAGPADQEIAAPVWPVRIHRDNLFQCHQIWLIHTRAVMANAFEINMNFPRYERNMS